MSSKGVEDRVFACAPTMWAAFAYSEFVAEAIRRRFPRLEAGLHERQAERGDGDPRAVAGRYVSLPQLMRGSGAVLGRARDRMVAADHHRERQRAALEEDRRRRDELVKTVYGRVVWARDLFEERVGRRRTTSYLEVTGETPRDPKELLQVARRAAGSIADPGVPLKKLAPGVKLSEQVVSESMLAECEELAASLKAIDMRESKEKQLITVREQRIAELDELRGKVGRFLERLLELVEMPTLAVAVRPELEGTGRRGRPSARPPRDLFPDLVAAALALDPDADLTLEEIRDLVPRRPVEYRRLEDVPADREVLSALAREAAAFRGEPHRPPEEAGTAPDRLDRCRLPTP